MWHLDDINCLESPDDLTPFKLTYVVYRPGDSLGFLLAGVSQVPLAIAVAMATLILFRRDMQTISFFLGVLLNEAVNWILKHSIQQERPCPDSKVNMVKYGMPSNHAQFMGFFAVYFCLFLLFRLKYGKGLLVVAWKFMLVSGTICGSYAVCWSRLYLNYHTGRQVLAGLLVGGGMGLLWFTVVLSLLTPLFPSIVSWPVSEFLMLRDTTLIPDVMRFEYSCCRNEARQRKRRLSAKNNNIKRS